MPDLSPILLAGVTLPFLAEIVALCALGALIAYLCHRIHLVPIAGFLITGVVIGPSGLGLVGDPELVNNMAEIGVILLLFTIGLEFHLSHLARLARTIFIGGGLQVGATTLLVAALTVGVVGISWAEGVYTGFLVALSSTAVVLGLLADRAETDSPPGQLSLSFLIFQDLAIIVMILLTPMLAGVGGTTLDILLALGKAAVVIVLVLVLSRSIVPRLLGYVAQTRRQEIFVLAVVAVCLGTAWLVSLAGVSLALGAFLAGLVVSDSAYREQALSDVLPFSTLFSAVFFVSVGMLLDLSFIFEHPFLLLGVIVGVVLLKALLVAGSALAVGAPVRVAAIAGLALAQVGEFSFVLERTGRTVGLSPAGAGTLGEQLFIASAVVLMLVTPLLMNAGPVVGHWLQNVLPGERAPGTDAEAAHDDEHALEDHVIVVGFGPAGRRLAQVLHEVGLPFIVLDLNTRSIQEAKELGYPAFYGDASRRSILNTAHVRHAKLLVVAINDRDAARRIVRVARHENPVLQIIVRARFLSDVEGLRKAGADIVIPEELETPVHIFARVLEAYRIAPDTITNQVRAIRAHDYEVFLSPEKDAHLTALDDFEEGLHTRVVTVRAGAPVADHTLAELRLRQEHGLAINAIRRGDDRIQNPDGSFTLQAGDRLLLSGPAERFARECDLFRPADATSPAPSPADAHPSAGDGASPTTGAETAPKTEEDASG